MPLSQDYDIPGCELDKDLLEWLSLRGKTLKDLYLSTKRLDIRNIPEADAITGHVDGVPGKQCGISVRLSGEQVGF